jgi:DNA-binding PadR family transcriptional regulator
LSQSLTNAEVAVLGLIAEQPRHAYQLNQVIEERGMREWTDVAFSSIYYVLNRLEKQGLVSSRKVQEGHTPPRRVYTLTDEGRAAVQVRVKELLSYPQRPTYDLDLAIANLPLLSREEAVEGLETYLSALETHVAQLEAKWQSQGKGNLPLFVDGLFEHALIHWRAELNWITKFTEKLKGTQTTW